MAGFSLILALCAGAAAGKAAAPAPLIRQTPPAPVVADSARVAELTARRARVAEQLGPKSVLVLFSGEPRPYAGDVDYPFRQENNLFYLTQLAQAGATLVLLPGNSRHDAILFLPRRNPGAETWTGHMYSPAEAQAISGLTEIWDAREFAPFMQSLRTRSVYQPKPDAILLSAQPAGAVSGAQPAAATTGYETLFNAIQQREAALYLLLPGGEGVSHEYRQEQAFAAKWAQTASGLVVRDAWPIFTELRVRKSPLELTLLQHAIDISIEAHERAQAMAAQARWEYEIAAVVDYTYKQRGADGWGYPHIVGCGANATTLHYEAAAGPCAPGQLLLMDVGAEYGHYAADITRTVPLNGRFSPAQADIYNVVLAAQEQAISVVKPGASFTAPHAAALEVIKDGLLRLGLITERNSLQYRLWFMHGTSHFLGMNVHDVGRPGLLEPGMVFTVEPGLYVSPDALANLPDTPQNRKFIAAVSPAFEKYRGIGVRIEDDILVTPDGARNLSAALPRTIPEIESFHARAARERTNEPGR